ncbi:hypothetical protein NDU88_009636 [Pleurodeles waltl]|uniref:Uncharacterized protein n=1 Tax=Pleurodeles waltl TaxID=8319 RepID=A0AAV7QS42_PLEWA|nr:hypothetical protein NDU88_009636 [Pleurodeles waltl]
MEDFPALSSRENGPDPEKTPGSTTLQDILQAITASQEVLEGKPDSLATNMRLLHDGHRRLADWVTTTENTLKEISQSLTTVTDKLHDLETNVKELERRAEDSENRARRNNVSIIGFTEYIEGWDMVGYLEL